MTRKDAIVADTSTPKPLKKRTPLLGALFLMATSAIDSGFITQTGQFTYKLGASFAFAILVSVVIDIAVQLNVWRVIGVSGQKAQQLSNAVFPGLGVFLAILVALGGFVFNVGNVAGGGLGLHAMLDMDAKTGGIITAVLSILVFLSKRAGAALDKIIIIWAFS